MRKVFVALVLVAAMMLAACTNPLFVNATRLYEVSFSTNGGSGVSSYRTYIVQEAPHTEREGYSLVGWYLSSSFEGGAVTFPLELEEDTTLYARWQAMYTVQFESNGGTEVASYTTGVIESSPDISRTDYIFDGWYASADFSGGQIEFPYIVPRPITLYAKWLATYIVSFSTDGGSAVAAFRTAVLEEAPETTRDGYTFCGWYKDAALTSPVRYPYTLQADSTLYAKWQQEFTVTFVTNGGSAVAAQTAGYIAEEPATTKSGQSFAGWFEDSDFSGSRVAFPYTVRGNVTLYAKWVAETNGKDYAAMVGVAGGTFQMGDPSSSGRPTITLSGFQIAQYELTYELWEEVYTWAKGHGYTLTKAGRGYAANDQFKSYVPATKFSWNMACVWLNAYSEYKGLEPVYYRGGAVWRDDTGTSGTFSWNKEKNGYRLPTECEWEYAAGGGSLTEVKTTYSGSNTVGDVAWYSGNAGSELHPVGTKKANALGIYDMSGNVLEWCYDTYASFGAGELTDPIHGGTSTDRVIRGGYLNSEAYQCTIFHRYSSYSRSSSDGIRIARNAE